MVVYHVHYLTDGILAFKSREHMDNHLSVFLDDSKSETVF